ncbi:hypothetical protein HOY80DRAFT_959728 [Tuber brumale]|nr:hypothetical protein HOY80DRAFT_959728 [Tuber brumale]
MGSGLACFSGSFAFVSAMLLSSKSSPIFKGQDSLARLLRSQCDLDLCFLARLLLQSFGPRYLTGRSPGSADDGEWTSS